MYRRERPAGVVGPLTDDSCPSLNSVEEQDVIPHDYSCDHVLSLHVVTSLIEMLCRNEVEICRALQERLKDKEDKERLVIILNSGGNFVWMPSYMNSHVKNTVELNDHFKKRLAKAKKLQCRGSNNVEVFDKLKKLQIEYDHLHCVIQSSTYLQSYQKVVFLVKGWLKATFLSSAKDRLKLQIFTDEYFSQSLMQYMQRTEMLAAALEKNIAHCKKVLGLDDD